MSNKKRLLSRCPVCNSSKLSVTEMECLECKTQIRSHLTGCEFCRLSLEEYEFVKLFVLAKGSLKKMEEILGVSYPTVKNRLEQVVNSLSEIIYEDKKKETEKKIERKFKEILDIK
jgi:hypothetical protein